MDVVSLIKIIIALVVVLGIALYFFLAHSQAKKAKQKVLAKEKEERNKHRSFDELLRVVKNKKATTQELKSALDEIVEYYGTIPDKLGIRLHPEFYKYSEVLLRLCRHKNTNKDLVFQFYKALERRNPKYAKELDDSLTRGLNARGL